MTYPNDVVGGMREVAEDLQNDARTCEPIATWLAQPDSASVLTAVRGKVRRIARESVEKQRLELLAAQLENGVPADMIKRQLAVMAG